MKTTLRFVAIAALAAATAWTAWCFLSWLIIETIAEVLRLVAAL